MTTKNSLFQYGGVVQETQLYGTVIRLNEPVGVIGIVCPDKDPTPLLAFVSLGSILQNPILAESPSKNQRI
jgi:hypothetical protein